MIRKYAQARTSARYWWDCYLRILSRSVAAYHEHFPISSLHGLTQPEQFGAGLRRFLIAFWLDPFSMVSVQSSSC
jgi:hypothetical protein